MKSIDLIAGARPNFVKIASILAALENSAFSPGFHVRLIHTGQHYDRNMSDAFFAQLGIREPDINLGVGSGTHAEQVAAIMVAYEKILAAAPSDICLVVGDVNSTLAASLVAKKAVIEVAHVEAGIRSFDLSMPEEINRMATDALTDHFFTTTRSAGETLIKEGHDQRSIHFVGNTMIDTLLRNRSRFRAPTFFASCGLTAGRYCVLTMHRPANVDGAKALQRKLRRLATAMRGIPMVFPVHPRVRNLLPPASEMPANLIIVEPQPYLEFNYLVEHAFAVLTDSGGITEETTVLNVPCLTLRDNTERPETVEVGTNVLVGADMAGLDAATDALFAGRWRSGSVPELWDGKAGQRIASALHGL